MGYPEFSEVLPFMEGIPSLSKEKSASSVLEEIKDKIKKLPPSSVSFFAQKVLENLIIFFLALLRHFLHSFNLLKSLSCIQLSNNK